MERRKTNAVTVGKLVIGGDAPIVVQSMLTTPTLDTEACVQQAICIIEAGGELVRITAQGIKEAENLKNIHNLLRIKGYDTPLSADIHFNPEAAIVAARYVEKVRINPGNFADKRAVFRKIEYTDDEYAKELFELRHKFKKFLDVCTDYRTAIRIGTNHGSLSDRIMSRYGDTSKGMVEATMEYLRICKDEKFDNVVISLKSSDCRVMIDAVRMLIVAMDAENIKYPIHLGVTEAGEGEDGRIRSAIGIGTLLKEGIGDTIRVSLTEPPEDEILVARQLISNFNLKSHDYTIDKIGERIIVTTSFNGSDEDKLRIAANIGGLFVDRKATDLKIMPEDGVSSEIADELARNILQAAGVHRYKAEFISCPGCGRTLFDLQGAVAKVKAAFSDLKHLKIAIMGCVVNGPGEMGDADYGYVGAGYGKVNLYKGRQMIKAGVSENEAIEELRRLITEYEIGSKK
ncbi:MAG: (E)-4-hydroxy-3-methylbut-2-enyl-diphosphate synthase [Culturomica sp.]|jgi:(E)-4-hydroxy-3-methylbut-2-enyl-diphosphate synthase|nr:(E)-4-hydroxy-3-methylbut-2-enyl-diphosphate synthase [Culturomica sp.]